MRPPSLALGTAQLGLPYGRAIRREKPSFEEVRRLLRAAFEAGVRCLDTAPDYGDAEERIGRVLREDGRPEGLCLCTKLPRLPGSLAPADVARRVAESIEGSLERLGAEVLDVYLVHAPADLAVHGRALVDALGASRAAGRVRHIGVSVYDPHEVEAALAYPELTAIQYPFHLFDARMVQRGWVARLHGAGHATFARSALLQGLIALDPEKLRQPVAAARPWLVALQELCDGWQTTPVELALSYAAARSGAQSIVLGVDGIAELHAALDALAAPLAAERVAEVEARFAEVPAEVADPRRWEELAS